ncbi:MAG: hypothetical protein CSA05_01395 [Bacteroidia bacterium]|nr:MAG: hypothetical protein CSA05_01395 [Bacteroidia bacterium]
MNKKERFPLASILIMLLFVLGCANESQKNKTEKDVLDFPQETKTDQLGETFYQIPSPEELFAFVQEGDLTYKQSLLNDIENASKYTDVRAKELNFGIYIADLAYAAAFSRYQESIKNIESVRKLSEEIGISAVFDEALSNRIQNIFENSDSLLNVTNSSYYKIVSYLEENERGRTLALISAGGWLESLYIFTNLVNNYSPKNPTIQRIADQKLTFENLISYLKKHQEDNYVKTTIEDLAQIQKAFNALEVVKVKKSDVKSSNSHAIIVGGSKRISITEEQFNNLKKAISDARNKITAN